MRSSCVHRSRRDTIGTAKHPLAWRRWTIRKELGTDAHTSLDFFAKREPTLCSASSLTADYGRAGLVRQNSRVTLLACETRRLTTDLSDVEAAPIATAIAVDLVIARVVMTAVTTSAIATSAHRFSSARSPGSSVPLLRGSFPSSASPGVSNMPREERAQAAWRFASHEEERRVYAPIPSLQVDDRRRQALVQLRKRKRRA